MNPLRRLSVAEQAEQSLRTLILEGAWASKLPPIRKLAVQMGISIPPLLQALKALSRTGELVKGDGTRSYAIGTKPRKSRKVRNLLLVIADTGHGGLTGADFRVLDLLRERLAKTDTAYRFERLDFAGRTKPLAKWDRLLEQTAPSHLAFIRGNQTLLDWADAHGLPSLLVGSRDTSGKGRKLAVRMGRLVDVMIRELLAKGHRRLLILLHSPNAEGVRLLSDKLAQELGLDAATLMRERWVRHIPEGPAKLRGKAVVEAVRSLGATAVLTIQWEDYLMTLTALGAAGIRVPTNVSMACASHSPDLRHVLPPPAHFVIPESAFADGILRWLRSGKVDPDRMTQLALKTWSPGESVGRAP